MNHCTDCQHSKEHAQDMIWCPKTGHVRSIEKPIDCKYYQGRRDTSVMLARLNQTVDLFGVATA